MMTSWNLSFFLWFGSNRIRKQLQCRCCVCFVSTSIWDVTSMRSLKPRGSTKRTNQQTKVVSEGISLSHSQGESLRRERLNVFDTENLKCYQTMNCLVYGGDSCCFNAVQNTVNSSTSQSFFLKFNLKKLHFKWPSTSSIFIILDYTTQSDPFVKVAEIKTQTQKPPPGQTPLQQ